MENFTFIDLKLDYAFKLVFGSEGNEDLLLKLLNAIVPDRHFTGVTLSVQEQEGLRPDSRRAVFDIFCKTAEGDDVTVEMQYKSQDDFNQRLVFYSTFPVQNNLVKGDGPHGLALQYSFPPVYVIAITNFIIPRVTSNDDCINQYVITNKKDSSILLTDTVSYVTVELPKFLKELNVLETDADFMLYAIKNIGELEAMPAAYCGRGLDKLFEMCSFAAMTLAQQRQYLAELMAEMDEGSRMASAWNHGIAEGEARGRAEGEARGRAEGKAEGRVEIAAKLKAKGVPVDIISEATGLSVEQIAELNK